MKSTPENRYFYDAAGQVVMTTLNNSHRVIRHLDGEGRAIRRNQYDYLTGQYHLLKTEYAIYSSVLGKELTTVKSDGTKIKTNVYGIGGTVATQNRKIFINGVVFDDVRLEHLDPARESYTETDASGFAYNLEKPAELDPLGSNVGLSSPTNQSNLAGGNSPWGNPFGGYSCRMDGFEVPCSQVMFALGIGAAHFSLNVEVPFGIPGRWVDEPNPNLPPPTEANAWNTGVISRFVPMLFGSFGMQTSQQDVQPAISGKSPERKKEFDDCLALPIKNFQNEVDNLNIKSENTLQGDKRNFYIGALGITGLGNSLSNRGFFGALLNGGLPKGATFKWKFSRGSLYFSLAIAGATLYNARATATADEVADFRKGLTDYINALRDCRDKFPDDIFKLVDKSPNPEENTIIDALNGTDNLTGTPVPPKVPRLLRYKHLDHIFRRSNNERSLYEIYNPFWSDLY